MPRKYCLLILALTVGASTPLPAQSIADWVTRVLEASNLPVSTAEARRKAPRTTTSPRSSMCSSGKRSPPTRRVR